MSQKPLQSLSHSIKDLKQEWDTGRLWPLVFLTLSGILLLCGYEFTRSAANSLFKYHYGKESLPLIMALIPVGVIAVLYLYGRLMTWFGPKKTLLLCSVGSAGVLGACIWGLKAGFRPAAGVLFVFKEAYIVLILEQYWSYINSNYSQELCRRLNGPFCGLSSLGAISGALFVSAFAVQYGSEQMIMIGAGLTLMTAFFSWIAYKWGHEPLPSPKAGQSSEERLHKSKDFLGLKLFGREKVLIYILTIVVLTQVVSTMVSYSFQGILQDVIPNSDEQTAFSGSFFAALNGVAAICQFIVAPILMHFFQVTTLHIFFPLIHFATLFLMYLNPNLFFAGMAMMAFKSIDYSLFRATKETLYVPLSFDARYRAKEFIDVFGYRTSKGGTSLVVTVIQSFGVVLSYGHFALVALGAAALWMKTAILMRKHLNQ